MEVPEDFSLGSTSFKKSVTHTVCMTYCSLLNCADYSMIKHRPPEQNVKSVITAITTACYLSALLSHVFLSFQPEINRSEHLGWPS